MTFCRAFTELTEYRIYEDLRRGWRVVQPNLENVGLLRVGYRGLETLCADNARWRFHPASRHDCRRPSANASSGRFSTSSAASWPSPAAVCKKPTSNKSAAAPNST